MAQSKVTLNEVMMAVRELTFDRFIIPAFAIKQMGANFYLDIDKTFSPETDGDIEEVIKGKLTIYKVTDTAETESEEPTKELIVELAFNDYPTLEDIMNALIEANVVVAYTPYFRGTEPSTSLIQVKDKELTEDFTAFRRYFFSDEEIEEMTRWYYFVVLDIKDVDLTDETIGKLIRPSEKHLAIWVSYYLVDKRRLYENAAKAIGQTFTDGSDYTGSSDTTTGTVTTVQIGSVFNITEDPNTGYFYEDFNRVGSDNVWGDRYSFWYRLMLYLRDLLETQFGDYSLRKDNVIPGYISLQRELDFRSYYDSYPFTLSPLSRGILSKTP
jgi:hypothetical protein